MSVCSRAGSMSSACSAYSNASARQGCSASFRIGKEESRFSCCHCGTGFTRRSARVRHEYRCPSKYDICNREPPDGAYPHHFTVIDNIPFAIKKERLVEIMIREQLPLPCSLNYHFVDGVFRGKAFASFSSAGEAAQVIAAFDRFEILGRRLRVNYICKLPVPDQEPVALHPAQPKTILSLQQTLARPTSPEPGVGDYQDESPPLPLSWATTPPGEIVPPASPPAPNAPCDKCLWAGTACDNQASRCIWCMFAGIDCIRSKQMHNRAPIATETKVTSVAASCDCHYGSSVGCSNSQEQSPSGPTSTEMFGLRPTVLRNIGAASIQLSAYECPICMNAFPSLDDHMEHFFEHPEPFVCRSSYILPKIHIQRSDAHLSRQASMRTADISAIAKDTRESPIVVSSPHTCFSDEENHTYAPRKTGNQFPTLEGQPGSEATNLPLSGTNKKFPCQLCNKQYRLAKNLKRHMLQHTGERPYKCVLCSDAFSRSDKSRWHFTKCSVRHGNPTGATHLSIGLPYSQDRLARRSSASLGGERTELGIAGLEGSAKSSAVDESLRWHGELSSCLLPERTGPFTSRTEQKLHRQRTNAPQPQHVQSAQFSSRHSKHHDDIVTSRSSKHDRVAATKSGPSRFVNGMSDKPLANTSLDNTFQRFSNLINAVGDKHFGCKQEECTVICGHPENRTDQPDLFEPNGSEDSSAISGSEASEKTDKKCPDVLVNDDNAREFSDVLAGRILVHFRIYQTKTRQVKIKAAQGLETSPDDLTPSSTASCLNISSSLYENLSDAASKCKSSEPSYTTFQPSGNDVGLKTIAATGSDAQPSSSNSSGLAACDITTAESIPNSSKRQRPGDREGEEDSDQEETLPPPAKQQRTEPTKTKLFACPYSKCDPARYSTRNQDEKVYRRCASKYLPNISRVKMHLKRVHRQPKWYCGNCYVAFITREEQIVHDKRRDCAPLAPKYEEMMTDAQEQEIWSQRFSNNEESWHEIFRILFPHAIKPLSAYASKADQGSVQQFVYFFECVGSAHFNNLLHDWQSRGRSATFVDPSIQDSVQEVVDEAFETALSLGFGDGDRVGLRLEAEADQSLPAPEIAWNDPVASMDSSNMCHDYTETGQTSSGDTHQVLDHPLHVSLPELELHSAPTGDLAVHDNFWDNWYNAAPETQLRTAEEVRT